MSQQKKQHYVPVFHLKNFSSDGKRINLWNISSKKKRLSVGLKGQCQKNFFYGNDRTLEKMLGDIENNISQVLKDIAKNNKLPPIWHQNYGVVWSQNYEVLMRYILIQYLRTRNTSEVMIDQIKQKRDYLKKFEGNVREGLVEEIDQEYEIIKQRAPQIGVLSSLINFEKMSDLTIKLLINKTKTEFITSDHPVVLYNQLLHYDPRIQKIPSPTTGLSAKGIQLFFPISPTQALLMYDDDVYSVGNSNKTNIHKINFKQDVRDINVLQMCSGSQNIYFKDDTFDVDELHNISEPYIKKILNDSYSTPEPKIEDFTDTEQTKSSFLVINSRGIYTNLNLSFIQLKPDAKQFQTELKRSLKSDTVPVDKIWRELPVDGTGRSSPFADLIESMKKNIIESMEKEYTKANKHNR